MTSGLLSFQAPDADAVLEPLLPAIARALRGRCAVVALSPWTPTPYAALLPFHLLLRWVWREDALEALPLHAHIAYVPCAPSERAFMESARYAITDVWEARQLARTDRIEGLRAHRRDGEWADWEVGVHSHRLQRTQERLPGASFIEIDTVLASGSIRRGARPRLGRIAKRQAPRPTLLVNGRGRLGREALQRLCAADLVIINLQRARSARVVDLARRLLASRRGAATVVLCVSPVDILALERLGSGVTTPPQPFALELVSAYPDLTKLAVKANGVGRRRAQEERSFDYAIEDLRGHSAALDAALDRCILLWWRAWQSLDTGAAEAILLGVGRERERLRAQTPIDAGLLDMAWGLIQSVATDASRANERLTAALDALDAHLRQRRGWRTRVVVGSPEDRAALVSAICAHWGLLLETPAGALDAPTERTVETARVVQNGAPEDAAMEDATEDAAVHLAELGVEIHVGGWSAPDASAEKYDGIVLTAYRGPHALDDLLAVRASAMTFILDPLEARVAHLHLRQLASIFQRAAALTTAIGLERIAAALEPVMASQTPLSARVPLGFGSSETLDWTTPQDSGAGDGQVACGADGAPVVIRFRDGGAVLCAATQRFERVVDGAGRLKVTEAAALEEGDEIVWLPDGRNLFSEQLLRALDRGVLRVDALLRMEWLGIITAMAQTQKRSARSVAQGLRERGYDITAQTARTWIRPLESLGDAACPRTWRLFCALADELGVTLPEDMLHRYFAAVRRWRVHHRTAGRRLTRLMRLSAVGRVDTFILDAVEAEWGVAVRALLQKARLRAVDGIEQSAVSWP